MDENRRTVRPAKAHDAGFHRSGQTHRQILLVLASLCLVLPGLVLLVSSGRLSLEPQPARPHRIGLLTGGSALPAWDAFREGLRDLGHVEGQNILIEYRVADGHPDRIPALVAELVELDVAAIVVVSDQAIQAMRQATTTIPIVMVACDAVAAGFIASLARPGGNVTGVTCMSSAVTGKRLELLRDTLGTTPYTGVLWNAGDPGKQVEWGEIETAAQTLGGQLESLGIREAQDINLAFETATRKHVDALVVLGDGFTIAHRSEIISAAARNRLPAMYAYKEFVEAGGLMAYGPSLMEMFRRNAYYVDRILKGTKPADLPVEQPMTFEFVINLKTAQVLGLTIPHHVLLQATEVLE